jgi:preprotein translocase subunit SecG
MQTIVLVIHMLIAVALVGVVLVQKSEGGGLGMGGGTMGGMMTARGSANLLTRTTAILAGCFFATSLILAIMAGGNRQPTSVFDRPAATESAPAPAAPAPDATAPAAPAPAQGQAPAAPQQPAVPTGK